MAERIRELTLAAYARAEGIARDRGLILADTKFEFGRRADGTIVLADEVLTPDSSRFWDAESWQPGGPLPSYDKQFVRDWLLRESGWDRNSGADAARAAAGDRHRHPREVRPGVRAPHRAALRDPLTRRLHTFLSLIPSEASYGNRAVSHVCMGNSTVRRHRPGRIDFPTVARVVVDVMPKPEILDPQGKAVTGALKRLGFAGVSVRQGKRFELELEGELDDDRLAEVRRAAETLLANTVIETFDVRVEPTA